MSRDSRRHQAASGKQRKSYRQTTSSSRSRNQYSPARRGGPRPGFRPEPNPARAAEREAALRLHRELQAALELPAPPPATFAELGVPALLVARLAAQGIHEPFAIQSRALPDALAGRDVLGRAQTGSGKTLAFGVPMLARLAGRTGDAPRREKSPRGLILVPTRELARQVADVLVPLGHAQRVSVMTVYGGVAISRQIDRLRRGVDIVVATPGRLIDLMERNACALDQVSITVLDEADHMADLGFLPSVTQILDATPAGGQRMLFSATLDRGVAGLVTSYLSDPALHAVAPAAGSDEVQHEVFVLPAGDKLAIATEIAGREGRTLIFVRTKHGADRLAGQLTRAGVSAAAIHGDLNQNQRQRALAAFTAGDPRVLVATDVAARGIHVDDVGLVVHYDPPHDHKDYLHRSGRTARAGAAGAVLALVEPSQVKEVGKIHDAAGVKAVSHHVAPGHQAVREVAESGTPIAPVVALTPAKPNRASNRRRPHSARPARRANPRRAAS
ncbi:MAG TPA: DEAD/DEAH box helicase [Streptosporangiaceae bacterium]|nr:DEAD/DEAH box helicase [Streptosporangiaceae bacterium]